MRRRQRDQTSITEFEGWLVSLANLQTIQDSLKDIERDEKLNAREAEMLKRRIEVVHKRIEKLQIPKPPERAKTG